MNEFDTLAHELRMIAGDDGDWVAGPINASILRETADAIDSLQNRLQELQGEVNHWKVEQTHAYGNWEDACKRVKELEANNGTHWHDFFGTPERAARTLEAIPCGNSPCSECPIFEPCLKERTKSNALLEWLETRPLDTVTCELVYGENSNGVDGWWCQSCGGWFAATFEGKMLVEPAFCQCCGAKAVEL